MTATPASVVARAAVGASGWSYPSWRPGFYPAETRTEDLLAFYASRLPAVELNSTGYRLPKEEQFRSWGEQTPAAFRFAVKAPRLVYRQPGLVCERVAALGARLGCLRIVVEGARDDTLVERLATEAAGSGVRIALDTRHTSWDGSSDALASVGIARVGDWESALGWRYVRFRDPPYAETDLRELAARLRPLLDSGLEVYGFFRHEDEPTAPLTALRLLALLGLAG
jgi:uncharacterized protein YecE (DUF72 family)